MIEDTNKISKSSEIRQYSGTGEITFETGEKVSCDFNVDCEYNGKSNLMATIFLNKENYFILKTLYNGFLVAGRFHGIDRNNAHIGINRIVLDTFTHSGTELIIPILQHYKLNYSTKDLKHEQIKLFFFIQSSINVIYDKIVKDKYVLLSYGLVNFNLGFNSNELILPNIILKLNIDNFEFKFVKKFDYNDIYSESERYSIPNVMCYVLVYTRQQNERKVTTILNNICLLLSIVNANWIVPLFCDSISERKIRKSILYKIKTYDFISSYYCIDNKNYKAIKRFIENAYTRFLENEKILSLNKVFEYYVSGLSTQIMQDRFNIGYIALDTLVQNARSLALTNNIKLIPNSVIQTRQKLENFFTEQNIPISKQQIQDLTDIVSYNKLSITTCQKYTSKHFGIRFYKETIDKLYKLRNSLFHGDEIKDFNKLKYAILELYNFLDILILIILGWRGNEYINKSNNFTKEIL